MIAGIDNITIKNCLNMKNSENIIPRFSFIILTWNSERYIKQCIESYVESFIKEKICVEFIIIDNGSIDRTIKIINDEIKLRYKSESLIQFLLIQFYKNEGTTKSRNIGIQRSSGEIIVICDSDTELIKANWKDIYNYLTNENEVGIVAPCLYLSNGSIQNSVKKFPTLLDKLKKILKIIFNLNLKDNDFYEKFPWKSPKYVDSAISAFWILTKSSLIEIGLLDENIFYSPEDLDYCMRLYKNNKKIVFYPEIKIKHHTQWISHNRPISALSINHFKGLLYYFKKHQCWFSNDK